MARKTDHENYYKPGKYKLTIVYSGNKGKEILRFSSKEERKRQKNYILNNYPNIKKVLEH